MDFQLVHCLFVLELVKAVRDSVLTSLKRLGFVVLCSVLRECAALALRGVHCPGSLELRQCLGSVAGSAYRQPVLGLLYRASLTMRPLRIA
jgi:hypothetical protein